MAIGLLTSSPPARPHYAYHTILGNLTNSFMDMDQLFQLLSDRLDHHLIWIECLNKLLFLKNEDLDELCPFVITDLVMKLEKA